MRREIYNTATVGYLYDASASATTYSQQYLTNGITLKDYMQSVINALPGIVSQCPVNMQNVQEYFPENYITDYIYTDLQGNTTTKTASAAIPSRPNPRRRAARAFAPSLALQAQIGRASCRERV
mgnify:CR=1 FL=1